MNAVVFACLAAAGMWMGMFSPWTAGRVPFWPAMTLAACTLATWAVLRERPSLGPYMRFRPSHLAWALGSAAVLYLVFLAGHHLAVAIVPWAGGQVARIYSLRESAPLALIVVLLLFIAPAEEFFWRGFVQRRLMGRWGAWKGFLIAAGLYAGVHIWAMNPMLLAAALLCGLMWGWILLRSNSLWPGIISHLVWDVVIFVLLPIL